MRSTRWWVFTLGIGLLPACATPPIPNGLISNLANVRTFAAGAQVVARDIPGIVSADEANCRQNRELQEELAALVPGPSASLPCDGLGKAGSSLLVEAKALEAYAQAINSIAQDQFVTTDADGKELTDALTRTQLLTDPVVSAVGKVFAAVETAALRGYRQHDLSRVMTGEPADAFKTVMASYGTLLEQYSAALDTQRVDIEAVKGLILRQEKVREENERLWKNGAARKADARAGTDYLPPEPVAVAEMHRRLSDVESDLEDKKAALGEFREALTKADKAFDAAILDLTRDAPEKIFEDVRAFASKVKDAHDRLRKAFG